MSIDEPRQESKKTVLVVDDESTMREYVHEVLINSGYDCKCFDAVLPALAYLTGDEPADLILSDIGMPEIDGLEFLQTVQAVSPELPVILLSGLYELQLALDALNSGATDYLIKPAKPQDILRLVGDHLNSSEQERQRIGRQLLAELHDGKKLDVADDPYEQVDRIFDIVGLKRFETQAHCRRVAAYALLFGRAWGLSEGDLRELEVGSLLHDIGKVGVPLNVLRKEGPLTAGERKIVEHHPRIGFELLAPFSHMAAAVEVVHCHHERFDGRGYPRRLRGEAIPLSARLFSIIDTFDAITQDRPYRKARPMAAAREEIKNVTGAQFDPRLVDAFLRIPLTELEQVRTGVAETQSADRSDASPAPPNDDAGRSTLA